MFRPQWQQYIIYGPLLGTPVVFAGVGKSEIGVRLGEGVTMYTFTTAA